MMTSRPTCARCGKRSTITVNGIDACDEHMTIVIEFAISAIAVEKGIPQDDALRAVARLFREALDTEDDA